MNTYKQMEKELNETITKEYEDIQTLSSIIESKQQTIADCLQVLQALEKGGFLE